MKAFNTISLIACLILLIPSEGLAQKKKNEAEANLKTELTPYERANSEFLMIEAQKFFLLEDYKRALAFLEKAIEVDQENHAAHFKMAEVHLIEGEYTQGLTAIEKAIELRQDNKYYYVLAAQIQKASQNMAGAAQYYELMLGNAKDFNAYLIEITEVYESLNQLDKALEVLNGPEKKGEALSFDQKSRRIDLLIKAGKSEDAISELAILFGENPKDNEVFYKYAYTLASNGKIDESIDLLEQNELKTNELILLLVENYQKTGAVDKQRDLIFEVHSDPEASLSMKTLLLGQWAFSDDLSDKANLIDSLQNNMNADYPEEPLVIENGGLLYSKLAKTASGEQRIIYENKAIDYFKRLTQLRPGDFQVWNRILDYEYQKEDWETLAESSEEALDLFPNQAVFYIYLASANQGLKEFSEAESLLKQASRMALSNESLKSQILGKQASLALAMGKEDEALSLFEQSINLSQAHPESIANYAEFLTASDPQKAISLINSVIDSPFKNLQFIRIKAKALFTLKNYSEANALLTQGLNEFTSQWNGKTLELSGDILFKLNLIDEALAQWKSAKGLGNTSDKLDQKIENKQFN
ncbi:tetratricopeptide repeat protein [Roseivirga sp. 4D4]|uniref:tetratricopeptide repeat protein n=1 Tax=Roseivirga sp. 4D4 TaxID=1889784 RepID=UPI001112CEDC|nr:tetratricopeptide repeat protein [Roseivirga sp. 4D4]